MSTEQERKARAYEQRVTSPENEPRTEAPQVRPHIQVDLDVVNHHLAVQGKVTKKGDQVKIWIPSDEGGVDESYLHAGECGVLSRAFASMAHALGGEPVRPTATAEPTCTTVATEYHSREVAILRSALANHDTIEGARAQVRELLAELQPFAERVPGAAAKLDDYQLLMALICNVTCEQHAHVVRVEVLPELERRLAARNVSTQCARCGAATTPASTVTIGAGRESPRPEPDERGTWTDGHREGYATAWRSVEYVAAQRDRMRALVGEVCAFVDSVGKQAREIFDQEPVPVIERPTVDRFRAVLFEIDNACTNAKAPQDDRYEAIRDICIRELFPDGSPAPSSGPSTK